MTKRRSCSVGLGKRRALEICVDEPAGTRAAIAGGADRLEVCGALTLGGITPSSAFVADAVRIAHPAGVAVHAMVRPRAGDFAYDADELAQAIAEARSMIDAGVDGLVFGAARNGVLDGEVLGRWVDTVRSNLPTIELTLHRAIDAIEDPVAGIDVAAQLGFDRVLTSGGAADALAGATTIAAMVAAAGDRLTVLAGASIRPPAVAELIGRTRVTEIHASASQVVHAADPRLTALGFSDPPRRRTDTAIVRALREALDQARCDPR